MKDTKRKAQQTSASDTISEWDACSDSTTAGVKELQNNQCWGCEVSLIEPAHVIPGEQFDFAIRELITRGLVDFDLRSEMNLVGLCPNCHIGFEDLFDPWFAFLPTDLEYFIEFELKDRARRQMRRDKEKGVDPGRRVPTAVEYQRYQESVGAIEAGKAGGLYRRLHLVDDRVRSTQSHPKVWHGAPFAAIRRAFCLLGSHRTARIPESVLNQLEILRDLYFCDDEECVLAKHGLSLPLPNSGDENDHEDRYEQPSKRMKMTKRQKFHGGEPSKDRVGREMDKGFQWDYGPQSTTEDVVARYAPQPWLRQ